MSVDFPEAAFPVIQYMSFRFSSQSTKSSQGFESLLADFNIQEKVLAWADATASWRTSIAENEKLRKIT
jgi:hypothetical protein